MTMQAYLEMFQNTVDVIEHSGGSIGNHPGIVAAIIKKQGLTVATITSDKMAALDLEGQQEYLAVAFLLNADRTRYVSYLQGVENDYLQGQDKYPKTVEEAHNVLTNWKQEPRGMMLGGTNDGVMFAHMEAGAIDASKEAEVIALATNGAERRLTEQEIKKKRANVTCHRCQQKGHYANTYDTPRVEREREPRGEPRQTGEQMLTAGIMDGDIDNEEGYVFHQRSDVVDKVKKQG
jgi:hypothetical protein